MEKNKRKRSVAKDSTGKVVESKFSPSKRQTIKERRRQQQVRQRRLTIIIILAVVLVIVGVFSFNPIKSALTPVGEFIRITPVSRPQADGRAFGNPNAPVKIDVYEDFQCPVCQRYSQEIEPQVINTYVASGQVYYVFRQFAFIDTGLATQESHQAANASMCAADQNRFWDYHDLVFANWNGENQGNLSDKKLIAFADSLGLDMTKFNQCFKADRYKADIAADIQAGQAIGVTGTPSIAINGQILKPGSVPSFDEIKQAVDAILATQ
jgi:protein-disulfide isomerase